ncbi:MAG TPA: hypothetical protein DCQ50_20590, partial [Chryseobacterium sp.]|nr:hypothetical protein [Chryseobacterium sp.]
KFSEEWDILNVLQKVCLKIFQLQIITTSLKMEWSTSSKRSSINNKMPSLHNGGIFLFTVIFPDLRKTVKKMLKTVINCRCK